MKKQTFLLIVGSVFLSLLLILFISNWCSSKESYADVNNNTVNLLYSDKDGNMGATSNVGLNSLTVETNTEIKGELKTRGNTSLNSALSVGGSTSLNSALSVGGNTSLNNILTVGGATSLNNGLTVRGNSTLGGDLTVSGNLNVKNRDILSQLDALRQDIDDLKSNAVRKDKTYSIQNSDSSNFLVSNKGSPIIYGSDCYPDGKWKFIQKLAGNQC